VRARETQQPRIITTFQTTAALMVWESLSGVVALCITENLIQTKHSNLLNAHPQPNQLIFQVGGI
jgi:hypothetical protein